MQIQEQKKKGQSARVKVAIRVRPMNSKQLANNQQQCVRCIGKNQIILAKQLKFDRVFDQNSKQTEIYNQCVRQLIMRCFEGYNASIIAYGQTGSGKTYTMGTSNIYSSSDADIGMLPRVIKEIYSQIQKRKNSVFHIKASFLQIYNQEINDLLSTDISNKSGKNKNSPTIAQNGGVISLIGLNQIEVYSNNQLLNLLQKGAFQRSTSSTLMNDVSSRSHAIFTITIKQDVITDQSKLLKKDKPQQGSMTAKFHFVDLAGSQRIKKTGATGSTLRQGISINMGLLCLGNVINALSNLDKKNNFVPYRDSKLTRILQDSLGGNSNTYMIACVSPAICNLQQTNCTLIYAARAMNIKNKPIVNRDPISALKQKITQLDNQNRKLRMMLKDTGIKIDERNFSTESTESREEIQKLKINNSNLEKKNYQHQIEIQKQKKRNNEIEIELLAMKRERDILLLKFDDIMKQYPNIVIGQLTQKTNKLDSYIQTIQQLKNEISDKQKLNLQIQYEYEKLLNASKRDEQILLNKTKQVYKLKKQIIYLYGKKQKAEEIDDNHTQKIDQTKIQQDSLDDDGIFMNQQAQFEMSSQNTCQQIDNVNKVIVERQKLLKQITNNQIDLEYKLISQMKQQYHNKIRNLQRQKEKLQKQMQLTVQKQKQQKHINIAERDRIVIALKTKREVLQQQLKEYKKKEKQQQNLQKLVQNQKFKIKELCNEIKNFRIQKLELNKRLKDDKDKFEKFKLSRLKEILEMKKKDIQKDHYIKKLTNQNKKTLQFMVKKDQEAKRLKRANDTLKQILQPKIKPLKKNNNQNIGISGNNLSSNINYVNISNSIMTKIICELDLQAQIQKHEKQIQQIQHQLNKYIDKDAKLKLELQRLTLKNGENLQEQIQSKCQQIKQKINQLTVTIQSLQQNLSYNRNRYQTLIVSETKKFDIQTELIYNKNYDSMQSLRKFLKIFLEKISMILKDEIKQKQKNKQLKLQNQQFRTNIQELQQQIIISNNQYQQNLARLRQELMYRSYQIQEFPESIQLNQKSMIKAQQKTDKKFYERRINDLTKKNKQLSLQLQQTKRKCDIVYQKYQVVKKIGNKDKFIGRTNKEQQQIKIQTLKQKRMQRTNTATFSSFAHQTAALEEVTCMLNNLGTSNHSNMNLTARQHTQQERKPLQQFKVNDQNYEQNNQYEWECISKLEGHNSPVLSLACQSNMLISTANKSLKLWDLQSNKIISDLTGAHLNGFVKSVVVQKKKNIMITACDKFITLWDLVTLQVISTLKGHKQQVRVLHINDDILFSGGKGSSTTGSIFSWDFRSINFVEQTQRNQDVFSFTSYNNILYYGSRNHQVRRINMENMEVLSPFDPPHFDMVTSMTTINDSLISGSKDKNLKLWSLNSAIKNLKNTCNVHSDYVNTLQSIPQLPIFYSGSRNGQVKVGKIEKQKIQIVGSINCHDQSVNTLCVLQEYPDYRFVTGSSDKVIKIWRPNRQTFNGIKSEQQFSD